MGVLACGGLYHPEALTRTITKSSPIILALGEQFSLKVSPGTRFSVGNPEVLKVRSLRSPPKGKPMLLVRAKRQGYSDLIIIDGDKEKRLRFRVYSKKRGSFFRDARASLQKIKGLEILPQGDQWIVRGESKNIKDYNLLNAFIENSKQKVFSLARLHQDARLLAEEKIRQRFRNAGLSHISVHGAGSKIWLTGKAYSEKEKVLALALAQEIFGPTLSYVETPFPTKSVLKFKIHILELIHRSGGRVGLDWNTVIPGILQIHNKLIQGNFSIETSLNLLARRGLTRILSKPEISVNSRGIARLHVGGEIPIILKTENSRRVSWKRHGLHLKLEIQGANRDTVRTKLQVSISLLDFANSIEEIPGIKENKMETIVDLKKGETFFLSGLLQNEKIDLEKSLPILGDIPILGALFRSKDFQERRSELIIAITAKDYTHAKSLSP